MRATNPQDSKLSDSRFIDRLAEFSHAATALSVAWEHLSADSPLEGHDFEGTYPFAKSFDELILDISAWSFKAEEMLRRGNQLAIDSPKWFEAIASKLREKGLDASADHTGGGIICVVVNVGDYLLYFGTANENWGFDVYSNKDSWEFNDDLTNSCGMNPVMQMTLSTLTNDPAACANAIAETVDIFKREVASGN